MKSPATSDQVLAIDIGAVRFPDIAFHEYQPGLRKHVLIHPLFDHSQDDPAGADAALMRYLPGAFTPRHLHVGHELVLVLAGDYIEDDISFGPGALIVRAPGTSHEMRSRDGCTFLAMRAVPVRQLT